MNAVQAGLAANPSLPPELLDRLTEAADDEIAWKLAHRSDLAAAQVSALVTRFPETAVLLAHEGMLTAEQVDPALLPEAALALLDTGAGPGEWARRFAGDTDVRRRVRLAACPGLPPDVVETLVEDPDVEVVVELALWAPADVTVRLARHPHADVRSAVANNEATPAEVLEALLTAQGLPPALHCSVCDREPIPFVHPPACARTDCELPPGAACDGSHGSTVFRMRERALRNPAVPVDAAARFAGDPVWWIRAHVAERPGLPPEVCRLLAEDPAPGVRSALAGNPSIDEEVMRTLAADTDPSVRRELAHHPHLPTALLGALAGRIKAGTALLPCIARASVQDVARLAASPDPAIRMLVAARRDLPAGVRDMLAGDPDAKVLKNIAPHPGLTGTQLRTLVEQHGERVTAQVAANPGAPPGLLADLATRLPRGRKALRVIAQHPAAPAGALEACLGDRRARVVAARHPRLPVRSIVGLLADDDQEVVEAAAANPSLPVEEMEKRLP
ncbi:hypothetical protein ABZ802_22790 [Streptomyces sp. NPDC047737]|uniref:hypothetical protein n=1 Tax=Streptomyces sp. NPDC047737 TaxID=3155740 RepID=UPI0033CA5488